jgi:GalNAc-alpha-(1->4)-GalNAc-alpha-(1->3)-diNAcBac-PP-undecaprenol alpha-1,4-N-acetyl-D-galactosaminyltransferase
VVILSWLSRAVPERKFVLVTSSLQCGGAERVLADMANYWAERGVEITYATWAGPEVTDFYRLDPRVRRVWLDLPKSGISPRRGLFANVARVRKLRRLIEESQPNAVLSFIHTSNVLTILASLGSRVRTVVSERMQPAVDPTLSMAWKFLRKLFYRKADAVITQSREAAQWIREHCGRSAVVIPNAVRALPPAGVARETLVLAIGRLTHQKGFDLLLRAFSKLAAPLRDWTLVIVGEGPERAKLLRLRDELDLGGRVEFVGPVAEIERFMARAGLVVQPSRYEGFPNAVLESMGMGAAVIAANCPSGPSDLIEDGVNGRLVPVEDVEALQHAMEELMSQPELRARLGREASKVRERFRQDRIMAQWEACLAPAAAADSP